MKFLDTKDRMEIIESDDYIVYNFTLEDKLFDLTLSDFYESLQQKFISIITSSKPVLFKINCDDLSDEDIDYFKDFIMESFIENLRTGDKKNEYWQPRSQIAIRLDLTYRNQRNLVNYDICTPVFNVLFDKQSKICYNMIKD